MAYTVGGPGTYTDLMAAVLSHAVADGWVEAGGVGTGWPISKGNIRGLDWNTYTDPDPDHTLGGLVNKTTRWINLCVGTTPADATAKAALGVGTGAAFPNMEYTIGNWWIFSDSTLCDYVHVVYQFSNGFDPELYGHFSFGEIYKHGMTYGSIAYAAAHPVRGFQSVNSTSPYSQSDANYGTYGTIRRIFTGRQRFDWSKYNTLGDNFCYIISPTNSPFPATAAWPLDDVLHQSGRLLDTLSSGQNLQNDGAYFNYGDASGLSNHPTRAHVQPYSGGVSMAPLPVLISNFDNEVNDNSLRFLNCGSFPNVRTCSLNSLLPGDEVTYGPETWKVFPLLCRKPDSTIADQYKVTSGLSGFAYKKVV